MGAAQPGDRRPPRAQGRSHRHELSRLRFGDTGARPLPARGDGAMIFQEIAFYLFSVVMIAAAFMVIAARNPVHSVLFLILAFFNAAGLFVLMGAEFLAMILVVVYVGAVAVLFLFVVMMLDINFAELRQGASKYLPVGLLVGIILLAELIGATYFWKF